MFGDELGFVKISTNFGAFSIVKRELLYEEKAHGLVLIFKNEITPYGSLQQI